MPSQSSRSRPWLTLAEKSSSRLMTSDSSRSELAALTAARCCSCELRPAQLQSCNARFELSFVNEATGVAVDEAIDAALNRRYLAIESRDLLRRVGFAAGLADASPILVRHAARIFQQRSHLIPHHLLKAIAAHGWIAALGHAVEPVCVRAEAAVVMTPTLRAIGWRERRRSWRSRHSRSSGKPSVPAAANAGPDRLWRLRLRFSASCACAASNMAGSTKAGTAISIHSSRGPATRRVALGTGRELRRIKRDRGPAGTMRDRPSTARPI